MLKYGKKFRTGESSATIAIEIGSEQPVFVQWDNDHSKKNNKKSLKDLLKANPDDLDEEEIEKKFQIETGTRVEVRDKDNWFMPLWGSDDRLVGRIVGSSGSGKSTMVRNLALMYNSLNEDNDIYLFSAKDYDSAFNEDLGDSKKGICGGTFPYTHLDVNMENLDSGLLDMDNYENCLVIFDDCYFSDMDRRDAPVQKRIQTFWEKLLKVGRSKHISVIYCEHLLNNDRLNKIASTESFFTVLFPQYTAISELNIWCKKRNFKGPLREKICDRSKRWVCVRSRHPFLIINQDEIFTY